MWSRSRSLLLNIEIQFPLNNFSLLWHIDTKLSVWVAYIKAQSWIATQMSVIKVKVTVTKKKIQFPLNNFSLFWPIDSKLGACNWCNQNNGIIFSSLPCFISYSCHINTWLKRWKPGFVTLRRFLFQNVMPPGAFKRGYTVCKDWVLLDQNCFYCHFRVET